MPATESWAGAWEQDYSFSTQSESESYVPMIRGNDVATVTTCIKSEFHAICCLTESTCSTNY